MLFNVIELHQTPDIEKSGVNEHEKWSFRSSKVLSQLVVIFNKAQKLEVIYPILVIDPQHRLSFLTNGFNEANVTRQSLFGHMENDCIW
jgi:hypothetical protein